MISPSDNGDVRMTAVRARLLPAAVFAGMAATVVIGLWLARHEGRELGISYPPFVGRWAPAATLWALLAAALLVLVIWAAPRLLSPTLRAGAFAAALFGLTLALRLALGATSGGTAGWSRAFDL